jgi:peroxiredoxin
MDIRFLSLAIVAGGFLAAPAVADDPKKKDEGTPPAAREKKDEKKRGLAIGDAAPSTDVKMENVDGRKISIDDAKGKKGTLVIFTCNHCPAAKAWEDRIAAITAEYAKKDVGVLLVNSNNDVEYPEDNLEAMKTRAREKKFEVPYVVDATSDVARAFGAAKTPEVFLFDANLKLAYHGAVDDNMKDASAVKERYLAMALESVLKGEKVAKPEVTASGCGIKFRAEKKREETPAPANEG